MAPVDPLVGRWTMPWALQGSRAGAIRNTVMVEDEENIRVSRHIRLEKKTGVASINRVMGRAYFNQCMVPMNWSSPLAGYEVAVSMVSILA